MVPPLRKRREDIPLLVETFLKENVKKGLGLKKTITPKALSLLCGYAWPGNVRELKNLVERLTIMVETDVIHVSDIPPPYNPLSADSGVKGDSQLLSMVSLKEAKRAFEKEFILQKLKEYDNNISRTARKIGVERSYLNKKIKQFSK
jgi:two-component system nitrogen regulation response regulator NtrX